MDWPDCNQYPVAMAKRESDSIQSHLAKLLALGARDRATSRIASEYRDEGYDIRELLVNNGARDFPATALIPDAPNGNGILYCHAHGHRYDIGRRELLEGRPAISPPFGPELARAGYTVLCSDMPGFGTRQNEGTESALAKAALWRGDTLLGRMLNDLMGTLDVLETMANVNAIGAFGMSMGATLSYWLAALDDRVSAVAHACALANIGPLIQTGAHDLHGFYMTVPGLLAKFDMGDVAAAIAPRPQFIACGGNDPLTPDDALAPALASVRDAYGDGGPLTIMLLAKAGHELTPQMRTGVLAFLKNSLARSDYIET